MFSFPYDGLVEMEKDFSFVIFSYPSSIWIFYKKLWKGSFLRIQLLKLWKDKICFYEWSSYFLCIETFRLILKFAIFISLLDSLTNILFNGNSWLIIQQLWLHVH